VKNACTTLSAFTHEVQAQAGKSITTGQANQLIADAQQIEAVFPVDPIAAAFLRSQFLRRDDREAPETTVACQPSRQPVTLFLAGPAWAMGVPGAAPAAPIAGRQLRQPWLRSAHARRWQPAGTGGDRRSPWLG